MLPTEVGWSISAMTSKRPFRSRAAARAAEPAGSTSSKVPIYSIRPVTTNSRSSSFLATTRGAVAWRARLSFEAASAGYGCAPPIRERPAASGSASHALGAVQRTGASPRRWPRRETKPSRQWCRRCCATPARSALRETAPLARPRFCREPRRRRKTRAPCRTWKCDPRCP